MKIVFIISSLQAGGAERVISNIANNFDNIGHNITILVLSKETPFYSINSSIELIQLGVDKPKGRDFISRAKHIPNIIFTLKSNILDLNPDIVISFLTKVNIISTIVSKLTKTPIIVSERTNFNALNKKMWRFLRRVIYPYSDALVVQSKFDKEKYYFHKNCQIIHNPIYKFNRYKNIKREKIVLAVGRLVELKGFDMLIEAFSSLKNRDWRLIIAGEGKIRDKLQKQIIDNKMEKSISLIGRVSDIERYYKKASIFVLSSRIEGFPNVLIEAISYGCPSIAFNCLTGPSDIIKDGENGLLVEANNVKGLSKNIELLQNNKELRDKFSKSGVEISKELSIDKISNRWLEVINSVLEKR